MEKSKLEQLQQRLKDNMDKAVELAEKNTVRNSYGKVVISKDDEWREDVDIKVPLVDMIFNPEKRKVIYRQHDKESSSSKEEDEIFEEMRGNIFNGDF